MTDDPVPSVSADPLRSIADAMDAAVQAAKDGRDRAVATAHQVAPAAGEFMSKAVYNTCYSVSYCVVLPALLAAAWIPRENAAVRGFIDGAHAAIDSVEQSKSGSTTSS